MNINSSSSSSSSTICRTIAFLSILKQNISCMIIFNIYIDINLYFCKLHENETLPLLSNI